MAFATHLIKIKGSFDVQKWTKEKLRKYIDEKISTEIYSFYHAEIELFQIKKNNIEIWVYISAFPSEATNRIIEKWIEDHIKEDGIETKEFKVEEKRSLLDSNNEESSQIVVHLS
ncbi:MAG: hypothetical protein U9P70_02700 [Patescibacteria group bacterium]|nr:hypothetical protein [Patescibacteria group bacterium]